MQYIGNTIAVDHLHGYEKPCSNVTYSHSEVNSQLESGDKTLESVWEEQLFDPYLLRLWRTGGFHEIFKAKDVDVRIVIISKCNSN